MTPEEKRDLSLRLQGVAKSLDEVLEEQYGRKIGFSLVVWGDFGGDNLVQYVSNAEREECAKNLQVLLDRWQSGFPDIPAHERQ